MNAVAGYDIRSRNVNEGCADSSYVPAVDSNPRRVDSLPLTLNSIVEGLPYREGRSVVSRAGLVNSVARGG